MIKLRKEAKELGVKQYSLMKKEELISKIREVNTKSSQTEFKKCVSCYVVGLIEKKKIEEKKRD